MYNYPPPGQYGRPPSYSGFSGQPGLPGMAPPPGMGAAPGMSAPGVASAPGMQQLQSPQQGGFPPNFQPPPNMPNINFSAPVIRLGTTGPGKPDASSGPDRRRDGNADMGGNRRGAGLGFDHRNSERDRHQMRDNMMNLAPPTREEIARTIFIGNITEGCGGDEGIQRILATAGGLRRWTRATDSDNQPCTFGFAEFEDAESLGTACELFKNVQVPKKRPVAQTTENGHEDLEEKSALLVVVDENSLKYVEEWRDRGAMKDPVATQFRLDSAKEDLGQVLASLSRPAASLEDNSTVKAQGGDFAVSDGETKAEGNLGEVVTIPIAAEDELSDIPAEMRETVAKEIQAFRDRSNKRDLERLKREEEMEQSTRLRNLGTSRLDRASSPSSSTPGGPGTSNGIPLGPRDRGVQGAPAGPKGYQGSQLPRDYQKGVSFVNGTGSNGISINREDEDSDASDSELERRRQGKKEAELEKLYLDQERRWLNREKSRTAAVEREKQRDKDEEANAAREKAAVAKRLKEWNDDVEANRKVEEYYHDRSQWIRNRAAFRAREKAADDEDRDSEDREKARDTERRNRELGMADQFLDRQAEELSTRPQAPRGPQPFKMSLGAAAQKAHAASAPRRTMAEVEGLLEDEEDSLASSTKRTLVPIQFDKSAGGPPLSEEEKAEAARQLARDIPTDKEGLWEWNVKWKYVDEAVVAERIRPFVEKKIVEYLGVQEQMLVDIVEQCVNQKGSPQQLVGELEGALDEEAEVLVKKIWRMIIFFSESESRGISTA